MTDNAAPPGQGPLVVVGAGRVGLFLARSLARQGRQVTGVVTRSADARNRVAVAALAAVPIDDPLVRAARTLLICVADDDLPDVVRALVDAGVGDAGQFVAHTSGRHGLGVLGALPGPAAAVHPAMTYTGTAADDAIPRDMAYGVTATGPGLVAALALVHELGGRAELVPDDRRPLYHASLSHAVNHLNTLVADAADLLAACGVDDTSALLGAITHAALTNALASGTAALTGPVVRGDRTTVAAHLHALHDQPAAASYKAMALRTAERAQDTGRLAAPAADAIRALLASGG